MPKKRHADDQYPDVVGSRLRGMVAEATQEVPAPPVRDAEPQDQDPQVQTRSTPSRPSRRPRSPKHRGKGERRSTGEFLQQHKARFTESEAAANDEIISVLSRALGTKPSQASLTRALWSLLRDCEEAALRSRGRNSAPKLNRPPNGFGVETVEYERRLAQYLRQLIREPSESE